MVWRQEGHLACRNFIPAVAKDFPSGDLARIGTVQAMRASNTEMLILVVLCRFFVVTICDYSLESVTSRLTTCSIVLECTER